MAGIRQCLLGIALLLIIKEANTERRFCRPEDGWFRCDNQNCVRREFVNGGNDSCGDGSDEREPLNCTDNEVPSRFNSQCLRSYNSYTRLSLHGVCSVTKDYRCPLSGKCIPRIWVMDNDTDCIEGDINDTSDENQPLQCIHQYEVSCNGYNKNNTLRCIPRGWVRDDIIDCVSHNSTLHAIDEEFALSECFNDTEFRCVENGRCIPRYQVFDGFPDCRNGSDEKGPIECHISLEFRCNDTGRCIPRSWRSNNIKNCPDGSDEIPLLPGELCHPNETLCNNGKRCIPHSYLCDGIDQCGDCSDEIENCLPDDRRMFRCPNDPQQKCIYWEYSCDAFTDCPNGGDDVTSITGFKCNKNLFGSNQQRYCVIPQWSLEDNLSLCDDQSDICYKNGTFVCSKCLDNKTIISPRQVCDGIFDCPDLSDECLCEDSIESSRNSKPLCDNVCYGSDSIACNTCNLGEIFCPGEDMCIDKYQVCDGVPDCLPSGYDELFCGKVFKGQSEAVSKTFQCDEVDRNFTEILSAFDVGAVLQLLENSKTATKCDGVTECPYFEDECSDRANCSTKPEVCAKIPFRDNNFTRTLGFGSIPTRGCEGVFEVVIGSSICNGIKECEKSGLDEAFCPNRISCDAGRVDYLFNRRYERVNIPVEQLCDETIDCQDGLDEMNCSSETHFYCDSGEPLFVHPSKVTNGFNDCTDGSDECPESYLSTSAISSNLHLIVSPAFNAFLWIMAFLALFGNGFVIITTAHFLKTNLDNRPNPKVSASLIINRLLILNLAVADILMGIVLLIIISKSLEFSGDYCLQDRAWRSSSTCDAVGVITVLSSEVSVLTLVCLTSYRLYYIFYPFKSRTIRIPLVYFWIFVTWLIPFLFATAPLWRYFSLTMITQCWIQSNPYFRNVTVSWSNLKLFSQRLIGLANLNAMEEIYQDWYSLQEYFESNVDSDSVVIRGYFGYYSASGLCIPRFYRTVSDNSDVNTLSLIVIALNFLVLTYIAGAYITIYCHRSVNAPENTSSDKQDQMKHLQRKITTLIITDMFCWLPICVMTFVSAGGVTLPAIAYAFSAIILLPINSSLNPIIYSDILRIGWNHVKRYAPNLSNLCLPGCIWKKFSKTDVASTPKDNSSSSRPASNTEAAE